MSAQQLGHLVEERYQGPSSLEKLFTLAVDRPEY
jgi:hypothetical protein